MKPPTEVVFAFLFRINVNDAQNSFITIIWAQTTSIYVLCENSFFPCIPRPHDSFPFYT